MSNRLQKDVVNILVLLNMAFHPLRASEKGVEIKKECRSGSGREEELWVLGRIGGRENCGKDILYERKFCFQ